ncbi:phenylacetate--CoA ligase family protein [Methanococcus voltae]|uniref:Phenylacetate--CoA ligase n=1 Tax=Methanococcus voltae (strain ATCC BAA-1334 / A3) TaxID=456320 RepID=D7DTT4_METV3|nr:phenylacetate--CoA ligase [Methanococcus voltae]MCS3900342.1 phenylacetate-CoA ligase [Methanococcus voltae]
MIWNKTIECMEREEMRELQSKRLCETVNRVYYNVPFYRNKMQELGVYPEDIESIDDIVKLPFTTKQDLRDNYPFGIFASPMEDIVRVHASSGTTGKPTVVGYTRKDITIWSEIVARTLNFAGVSKDDFIQIAYGYGLFTGGLGLHYGGERLGATVVPISGGNTEKQIQLMQDFKSSVIACTPSYALYLAESMQERGIDPKSLNLKVGIFGAEPWTEAMREKIEDSFDIKAYDIYGLSEVMGPGVACECESKAGLHINEDHFVPEIIDPNTLEQLPNGQKGELVFTTITKEGLPLLRYRTRDLTSLNYEKCECGRTLVRMNKCTGRSDDMLIIRGVNVFPSQIESALLKINEVLPHYMLEVDRVNNLDVLNVLVEVDPVFFSDKIKELEQLNKRIKKAIVDIIGINVSVKLVEPKTLGRSEGKSKRVIDKRIIQ